ncbi:MAG: Fic family protein [Candidatus Binatia bacterium]
MTTYVHNLPNWPDFQLDEKRLTTPLGALRFRQGRLIGRMKDLGFSQQKEATLETLTLDVLKSSEIEGEILDRAQVRSSIARRLGVDIGGLTHADRDVEGVVEMILDATQNYSAPLTAERLWRWHASLFPTGRSAMRKIAVGRWRDDAAGPMQVVSGVLGRERVHFEAPAATRLDKEMTTFIEWFNVPNGTDPVLRSGLAHLWFVTIHPFDDGNGRIARAIADMALTRAEESRQRFYSMSAQIRNERTAYYEILEKTQREGLDVTPWMEWFLGCLDRAVGSAERNLDNILTKARFWRVHANASLNERQRLMLNKLLDGFEGKLTSSKWATITQCSQDTASRDIVDLVQRGVLAKDPAGGRSTSYSLVLPEPSD